jgi:hypothetical protein
MHKTLLSLSCIFILGAFSMHAQRFQLREAGLNLHPLGTTHDFSTNIPERLPNSALVQEGFDKSLSENLYSEELLGSFWLGFHSTKSEEHGPVLRIGLLFGNTNLFIGSFQNRYLQALDSISSGGQTAFIDSVEQTNYNIGHRSTRVGVQAQYLYYWNKQNRFSLYGGVGAGFTTSFGGRYSINAYSVNFKQVSINNEVFEGPHRYNFDNSNTELERFSTGTGYTGFVSIPIGLNFRIGTNPDNFWGKAHMFWELAPSFNYFAVDPAHPTFFIGLIRSFGYRLEW